MRKIIINVVCIFIVSIMVGNNSFARSNEMIKHTVDTDVITKTVYKLKEVYERNKKQIDANISKYNNAKELFKQIESVRTHEVLEKSRDYNGQYAPDEVEVDKLMQDDLYLFYRSRYNCTLLHKAAEYKGKELTLELVKRAKNTLAPEDFDAFINAREVGGRTPLHFAIRAGNKRDFDILIDNGANIEIPSKKANITPLIEAVRYARKDMVNDLLKKGAGVNTRCSSYYNKNTALHFAAEIQDAEIILLLIRNGADVNALNEKGEIPINSSIIIDQTDGDVAKIILAAGADITKDTSGELVEKFKKGGLSDIIENNGLNTIIFNTALQYKFYNNALKMLENDKFKINKETCEKFIKKFPDLPDEIRNSIKLKNIPAKDI